MIHLDTSIAITFLNGRSEQVRRHFDPAHDADVAIGLSIIATTS